MTKLRLRSLLCFMCTVLIQALANADVTTKPCGADNPPQCVDGLVKGQIKAEDISEVSRVIERIRRSGRDIFFVDSAGGDIHAAIQIGRRLREARATVWMEKEAQCLSACVFLLAGAVERFPLGSVGIHRPYSVSTATRSYAETQSSFREIETSARRFLSDMNLPGALFDAMMNVPPQRIRRLSPNELYEFGLLSLDPVEQEVRDNAKARRIGISRQEFISRKNRAERVCSNYFNPGVKSSPEENYFSCTEAVLHGRQ